MAIDKALIDRIDAYLQENRDAILEDLKSLARIPSILGEAEEGAPFGKPCYDVLVAASELFKKAGCESGLYGGNRYALAYHGDGEKTIGIYGHCDVVPVSDNWILTSPFDPIEKDGVLVGRGVNDNKAGVTGALYLVKALKALDIKLKNKLMIYMGGAEETGMSDIFEFIKEQPMPDVSIVPDGSFPVCFGEKGMCRFWATAPEAFEMITDFDGGLAFNVVLDDVVVKIKDNDEVYAEIAKAIEGKKEYSVAKENGEIVFKAKGITRHAASPVDSINGAYLACNILKDVTALPEGDRKILAFAAHILDGYYGVNIGIDEDDATFGCLTCVNGMVRLADGKLKLSFDSRFGTATNSTLMREKANKTFSDAGWSFDIHSCEDGFLLDRESNPFLSIMENVYREVSGDYDTNGFVMAGGTYARRLKNAFSIGTQVPYKKVKLDLPAGHGDAHQSDEILGIDAFLEGVKILILMTIKCDEVL